MIHDVIDHVQVLKNAEATFISFKVNVENHVMKLQPNMLLNYNAFWGILGHLRNSYGFPFDYIQPQIMAKEEKELLGGHKWPLQTCNFKAYFKNRRV